MRRRLPLPVCLVLLLGVLPTVGSAKTIPFDDPRWTLLDAETLERDGRLCLMGSAFLGGIDFQDGVIEFDALFDGGRGYPGITFRATSPLEFENLYFRPHVSGRPDALQYAPAFGGVVGWQLYSGPGFTAAIEIPRREWIHVRVEILGQQARVFFGEGEEPDLLIDELRHDPVAGSVGIRSARSPSALFSNFAVMKTTELEFPPPPRRVYPRGLVRQWELSQAFKLGDVSIERHPDEALMQRLEWKTVEAEPSGLVDIARHAARSQNGESDLVFARVRLVAPAAGLRPFALGYSDMVGVFLNGDPMFVGDSRYLSRSETYSGIISLNDQLVLPLREGGNELLLAVAESFGGWGLMGQDRSDDLLAAGLERIWELDTGHRMPESALYDPERDLFYVSEYFRGGNETIARVAPDGTILEAEWVAGLSRPCGLCLHGGRLWAVDRRNLVEIDVESGEIVGRHPIPDARFPNDVDFDDQGRAYVTDTLGHRIYRYADGAFAPWLEGPEVEGPNGVLVDGDRLLWGNRSDGSLKTVPLAGGTIETLASFGDDRIVDGLRKDGSGGWLVSDFEGRLFHVARDGATSELLNTTASGRTCADFEYLPATGLLVVPGLYDNRLSGYRWRPR